MTTTFFDRLNVIVATLLVVLLFVLLALILQCTYDPGCNASQVASIFSVNSTIVMVLSVLDIPFLLGNTLSQVMFASRYETSIRFGDFLYGKF